MPLLPTTSVPSTTTRELQSKSQETRSSLTGYNNKFCTPNSLITGNDDLKYNIGLVVEHGREAQAGKQHYEVKFLCGLPLQHWNTLTIILTQSPSSSPSVPSPALTHFTAYSLYCRHSSPCNTSVFCDLCRTLPLAEATFSPFTIPPGTTFPSPRQEFVN